MRVFAEPLNVNCVVEVPTVMPLAVKVPESVPVALSAAPET